MKKFIIIIISAVIISACNYRIARHIWELEPPLDIKLKLNGYYYISSGGIFDGYYPAILYSDGTIFYSSLTDFSSNYYFENRIKSYDSLMLYKYHRWGRFTIRNDSIIIRYLELSGGGIGGPKIRLIEIKGKILNNEKFILTESCDYIQYYFFQNKKTYPHKIVYDFKPFSFKPDSLNWTFKYKEKVLRKMKHP